MTRRLPTLCLVGALAWASPVAARGGAPAFTVQSLELPGVPAALLPADMNRDGVEDLVVLVAYTGWQTRSEFEPAQFDEIEGLVEVMNVVDELVERRELRVYPAGEGIDGFDDQWLAAELELSVHALATGHPAAPLVAVTDEGAAAVRLAGDGESATLELTPLVTRRTSFAGGARFYPELDLLHDLDGDGLPELLLPTEVGWAVYRGQAEGFSIEPATELLLPPPSRWQGDREDVDEGDEAAGERGPEAAAGEAEAGRDGNRERLGDGDSGGDSERGFDDDSEGEEARPAHEVGFEIRDCDGDGRTDVLVPGGGAEGPLVFRGTGKLSFADAVELAPAGDGEQREVMYVGDLDGDGSAEVVDRIERERYQDPGWREEVDEAKRPLFEYSLRRLEPGMKPAAEPHLGFRATGYTFGDSEGNDDEDTEIRLPGGFQDLDGDGRQDLVAITLEFSLLPMAMRVLVVQRISLTMNFHVWCQQAPGGFREVPGLDLSGRFKLDLDNLQVRHLSQFAGDFDADGRADFVQLGRGKKVTLHLGGEGCSYAAKPDHTLELHRKLKHLGLARIVDLDADGRSDLYVVHPLKRVDEQSSIPARVDLYLSRL